MHWRAMVLALVLSTALMSRAAEEEVRWLEVHSPHFTLISNADEKIARRTAAQFEQFRQVFQAAVPGFRVDSGIPLVILGVKDEKTLKSVLPEFWDRKGFVRPAGFFLRGLGKDYVAVRLDAAGENPFHVIYHEYAHDLISLNYGVIPNWLNEGLAEFFAHTVINAREASVGVPGTGQLELLRRTPLLPLQVLFAVDYNSPYYTEQDKTTIFYAQSWALAHFLMMADDGVHRPQIAEFLKMLNQDVPTQEAATRAFGDLAVLARQLDAYVHQNTFAAMKVAARAAADDSSYSVREIPLAESLAIRADFLLHNDRFSEARKLLADALWLKPDLALANESMGFLLYRQGDRAGAEKWFANAVELDSQNSLAHYYHALALAREGEEIGDFDATEKHLRRAIELNPDFASAYSMLALAYATQDSRLEEALLLARRAVQLEPANLDHQLRVGSVLLHMERVEEAQRIAQRVGALAKTVEGRAAAAELLERIAKFKEIQAQKQKYEAQLAAEQKSLDERRLQRPTPGGTPPTPTPRDPATPAGSNAAVEGTIASAACLVSPAMELTIANATGKTRLHSENFGAVEYSGAEWQPPRDFQPCKHLLGLHVRIIYRIPAPDPSFAGEILAIEVKK